MLICLCDFKMAWVGNCSKLAKENPGEGGDFCDFHAKLKCSCGKQAIVECDNTEQHVVCGRPNCGQPACRCDHNCKPKKQKHKCPNCRCT